MAGVMFGNHLVLKFAPQKNRRRDGIVLRTGPGIAANSRTNTLFNRGVGFVFDGRPDKDGLVFAGVDFDGVIPQEGEISSFAAERVKRIGSYVEASVSRTGLHVILKARPLTNGIAHNRIEMYTAGRFFTMTGRGAQDAGIIAAPEAFAALAEELQAQIKDPHSGDGDLLTAALPENGEQTADAETNAWFGNLPPEKQNEVVRYAALHIAKNSKLFELTGNGGNYQDYWKLALALSRSGVAEAEDIFVEAASTAKDADADEALRSFFKNCEDAQPRTNGVTVGTLLYSAIQCGADFSQWKQTADGSGSEVAWFMPGKEEKCRKLLDCVVATDPRTYTLGDPTGPLVILRVPDKDALPPETRWEGDLPGTTLATPADIMQRAERICWMKEGKFGPYRIRPRATSSAIISCRCWANTGHGLCGALCGCQVSTATARFISFRATTPRRGSSTISHQPSTFR
jgi:hypothetical protein